MYIHETEQRSSLRTAADLHDFTGNRCTHRLSESRRFQLMEAFMSRDNAVQGTLTDPAKDEVETEDSARDEANLEEALEESFQASDPSSSNRFD